MSFFTINNINYSINSATHEDAEAIYKMTNDAYRDEITRQENHSRFDNIESVKGQIDKAAKWFILKCNDKLIGSVQVGCSLGKYSFSSFAMDRQYRGTGLGKKLLETVEAYVTAQNVDELSCTVMCRAKKPMDIQGNWDRIEARVDMEPYRLVDHYNSMGYQKTGFIEVPPLSYQQKTRLEKYHNRIFFLELKKSLKKA